MENRDSSWVALLPVLEVLVGGEVGLSYHPFLHLNPIKSWRTLCVDLPPYPLQKSVFHIVFLKGLFI